MMVGNRFGFGSQLGLIKIFNIVVVRIEHIQRREIDAPRATTQVRHFDIHFGGAAGALPFIQSMGRLRLVMPKNPFQF